MRKPFLTIDEQIGLLNARGVETDEKTGTILLSEGYYAVVNGYKAPFIDAAATAAARNDRYKPGTHFMDLYGLFLFDRKLREHTFHYLVSVETMPRTVCAYRFSEAHRSPNASLDPNGYALPNEHVMGARNFGRDLTELVSPLRAKAEDRNDSRSYIGHYRDQVGRVPLWVLVNNLNFGNAEHLSDLMRSEEQVKVCRDNVAMTGHLGDSDIGYLHPRRARVCIYAMVKYRNLLRS